MWIGSIRNGNVFVFEVRVRIMVYTQCRATIYAATLVPRFHPNRMPSSHEISVEKSDGENEWSHLRQRNPTQWQMAQAVNVWRWKKNKILAKLSHRARNPTRTPSIANAFHNQNIIYQRMKWSCTLAVALLDAHQQNYGYQLVAGSAARLPPKQYHLAAADRSTPTNQKKTFEHFSFAHSAPSRHQNSLELRLFVCFALLDVSQHSVPFYLIFVCAAVDAAGCSCWIYR